MRQNHDYGDGEREIKSDSQLPVGSGSVTHSCRSGSRGTDSPGDHQDFSNPMITCRSVPLPATTRSQPHLPAALMVCTCKVA